MRYVVLLRAISNFAMEPFREAMEELGFSDVESYGMSGNLLFTAERATRTALEQRIAARFGTDAFVRTPAEIAEVVADDPYGSSILFLARKPSAAVQRKLDALDFEARRPVLHGTTLYFAHPARLVGTRSPLDFEMVLGMRGTARSSRVATRLHELLQ